jgi:hypothetical protein
MAGTEANNDPLSSAIRRVAEARSIVERQEALIDGLRANGGDTEDVGRTLCALVQTLTALAFQVRSVARSARSDGTFDVIKTRLNGDGAADFDKNKFVARPSWHSIVHVGEAEGRLP